MLTLNRVEENYLKGIYQLSEHGTRNVLTNELAKSMHTKAASVTSMIKKLFSKQLIYYKKYYGVNVTSTGKKQALQIIRKHRLWETFLVHKLNFTWDRVHEVADQLEHIQSQHLIEKLDAFLEYPKIDPHGDPIPDKKGRMHVESQAVLNQLPKGYKGTIVAVKNHDSELLKYLEKIGAKPGKKFQIIRKEAYDNSIEIALGSNKVFISEKVSRYILVAN